MELKNLGDKNKWPDNSIEQRLVDMTERAGYKFREREEGTMKVYICNEAGLMYYVDDVE